jgi:uncharacterized SAM-binding protein YcdF (DUF218 family)
MPFFASGSRALGEVRSIHSNFARLPLKLRWAMKQIHLNQFDPARLLTYVLSRLLDAHAVGQAVRKSGANELGAERAQLLGSPARTAEEILRAAERRWPSRYY